MLLHGYSLAMHQHELTEAGRDFLGAFGEYLRGRFGWSMSMGPIAAIREAAADEDEWALFWTLVADYREVMSLGTEV